MIFYCKKLNSYERPASIVLPPVFTSNVVIVVTRVVCVYYTGARVATVLTAEMR